MHEFNSIGAPSRSRPTFTLGCRTSLKARSIITKGISVQISIKSLTNIFKLCEIDSSHSYWDRAGAQWLYIYLLARRGSRGGGLQTVVVGLVGDLVFLGKHVERDVKLLCDSRFKLASLDKCVKVVWVIG